MFSADVFQEASWGCADLEELCFSVDDSFSVDMSNIFLSASAAAAARIVGKPDIFEAAGLGDVDLVRDHILADPDCVNEKQHKQPAHQGIICDGCSMQNFSGPRFKCEQCPDFDLCSSCYHERNKHCETGHSFMAIGVPGEGPRPAQARGSRSRSPPALPAPPLQQLQSSPPQLQELQHSARIAMQQQQQAVASVHNVSMQARSKHPDHPPLPSADLGDVSVLDVLGAMRRLWWMKTLLLVCNSDAFG
jgi:hypothetical protein